MEKKKKQAQILHANLSKEARVIELQLLTLNLPEP